MIFFLCVPIGSGRPGAGKQLRLGGVAECEAGRFVAKKVLQYFKRKSDGGAAAKDGTLTPGAAYVYVG